MIKQSEKIHEPHAPKWLFRIEELYAKNQSKRLRIQMQCRRVIQKARYQLES